MLPGLLATALLGALTVPVQAVYSDEAFSVDWQLSTIGDYQCVFSNYPMETDQLVVLSQYSTSETLITQLNETTGDVLVRYTVPVTFSDAMFASDAGQLVLKSGSEFISVDLNSGLIVNNATADVSKSDSFSFASSCGPAESQYKISTVDGSPVLSVVDKTMDLPIFKVRLPSQFNEITYFHMGSSDSMRLIVAGDDSQYTYFNYTNGGENVTSTWTRDESLVDIVDSTFCNVNDHSLNEVIRELCYETDSSSVFSAYLFRLQTNYNRVMTYLKKYRYSPGRIITAILKENELLGDRNEERAIKRDQKFGLTKLLVVATKGGRIAALDVSKQGKIVWNIKSELPDIVSIEYMQFSREFVIISEDGTYCRYSLLDEFTAPVAQQMAKLNASSLSKITKVKKLDIDSFTYYVTFEDGTHEIVSPDTNAAAQEKYFVTDHSEQSINGYMVSDNKLIDTWSIPVKDNERVVAFAARSSDDVVNVGNVLGNRTVLYKYLYPNLVSYGVVDVNDNSLYVNLIDTVTGQLLYSQKHDNETIDVTSPVNLVFGENWYVYSYFSSEPVPEQKLTVVELYESLTANERKSNPDVEYNPLKGNLNKPEVASRSYFFPEIIEEMDVSSTKYGITSKAIIMRLENGQVTFVPKFVLNARSKEEELMSDDDKKEFMASPYIATIPINDHFIISHQRELVMGDHSQLISSPTNLESTSIICEVGKDVFCTRIYPSGQFDVMSPSFQKVQLMGTIFVIFVVLYYLHPAVATKKLKLIWLVKE